MKIENLDLEKALQNGWTEWKKYGKSRLYFNVKNSSLLDLDFYKSGNICFSEFKGEKISHSMAYKIIGTKVFIDLDTMELHVSSCEDEAEIVNEIVKDAVKKVVDEPKEDTDESKKTAEDESKPKELYVEVKETAEGITGNVLSMDWDPDNWSDFSDLFNDAVMSQSEYDRLCDVWNEHSTILGTLKALKTEGLIEDYEIKEAKND